ncbi:hypothetical protein [Kocuria rhizophila]|nr:hypothetical protein [Kocuria rhizophila]
MTTTWAAFYVSHSLDSVRHHDERLAEWTRYENLTNTTKTKTKD